MKVILLTICFLAVARGNPTTVINVTSDDKREMFLQRAQNVQVELGYLEKDIEQFIKKEKASLSILKNQFLRNATNIFKDIPAFAEIQATLLKSKNKPKCQKIYDYKYRKAEDDFKPFIIHYFANWLKILENLRPTFKQNFQQWQNMSSQLDKIVDSCLASNVSCEIDEILDHINEMKIDFAVIKEFSVVVSERGHLKAIMTQVSTDLEESVMHCILKININYS